MKFIRQPLCDVRVLILKNKRPFTPLLTEAGGLDNQQTGFFAPESFCDWLKQCLGLIFKRSQTGAVLAKGSTFLLCTINKVCVVNDRSVNDHS